jgi:hypothetical protein
MSQSVIYQYLQAGSFDITVPSGYSNQVLVYAWGGGGGNGTGAVGSGGGYAAGVVNINAGDSVTISVGGGGGRGDRRITTQTYERTVTTSTPISATSFAGSLVSRPTTIETITVASGVIPTPGVSTSVIIPGSSFLGSPLYRTTTYSAWTLVSSSSAIKAGGAGLGSNPIVDLSGGEAGASTPYPGGDDQYIGAGGGGGAASAVFVNNIPMLVAAGGGGGGGGSNYQSGTVGTAGGVATAVNSTARGATSVANYATGGGGGGGYPYGGGAGASVGDDAGRPGGGYGGQNYANASVTSTSLLAGSGINTAGTSNGYYPGNKLGTAGYDGCVIVVFQKLFTVSIKQSGLWKQVTNAYVKTPATYYTTATGATVTVHSAGWKQIVRGWLKKDGVWQNISTPLTLTSSKVSGAPSRRASINLVIASNTSSYNLLDTLNTLGTYYPGYSDITLTVNAGVTVNSNDSGGAALTIDGLTSGDSLIIVNNGTILGRGGYGGAAGYVSTITVGSGKNSTTTNSPQPGGAGGAGGTALAVTYATTLQNNGVIYAGGGGGGGGGISFNSVGGGQGGGGAGYGPGANAGTLTAGGAGGSNGGAGGSNGANGTAGTTGATYTYSSGGKGGGTTTVAGSPGGPGGLGGKSITGYAKVTVTVTGTIVGPTA